MKHILIFSIGPVQSFIAQARKTQDLYGGSRLLSELCLKAIGFAKDESKSKNIDIEVIFPVISEVETTKSIPNRFVGILKNTEGVDIQKLGEDIEEAVQIEFMKIANDTLSKYNIGHINGFKEQIENHLDINWLFYPIEIDYQTDYAEAEKWLGAVKNTRIFKQNSEKGRKCTLDGERNVKFYRLGEGDKAKDVLYSKLFQNEGDVYIITDNSKIPLSMLDTGEGLSAVSFVKRAFEKETEKYVSGFPSTAEITLQNILRIGFSNDEIRKKICTFISLFLDANIEITTFMNCEESIEFLKRLIKNNDNFNWQFFYEENLTKDYLHKQGLTVGNEKLRLIQTTHKEFMSCLKEEQGNKLTFSKYYALLTFDGDNMGKIMSGEFLSDKTELSRFQRFTSELLLEYAKIAENILKDKGETVYAGGDDFLGFINLTHLYEVMQELYAKFQCSVSQPLQTKFKDNIDNDFNFTFSAGITIAHYKTPLSIVLKKAREMEHIAKEKGDRDAFAIAALKHSGESHKTVFKWKNLQNLEYIHKQLQEENFSNTFIKNIQLELRDFESDFAKDKQKDFLQGGLGEKIAKKEIGRLVKRSKIPTADLDKMHENVVTIFEESKNFKNFSEALNIIQFIKRQIKSA